MTDQSGDAIGAVSALLRDALANATQLNVTLGRPAKPGSQSLNLYLYEAGFDASLKNVSLDAGRPAPLWLALKYLITSFDEHGESDSEDALKYLGRGLRALQGLSFLRLSEHAAGWIQAALEPNPEELKLTFDEVTPDLLSKIMQNPEEQFRFSMGFQVRPVMIASAEPGEYSLLVGIDYTRGGAPIGDPRKTVRIETLPDLGPRLLRVDPEWIEPRDTVTVSGEGLAPRTASLTLGPHEVPILKDRSSGMRLVFTTGDLVDRNLLSAGVLPLAVRQTLPSGRRRAGNMLPARILPRLDAAGFVPLPSPGYGTLNLTGELLGRPEDDVVLALYRDGRASELAEIVSSNDQKTLTCTLDPARKPDPGTYRVILRVNGQQAKQSPEVVLP